MKPTMKKTECERKKERNVGKAKEWKTKTTK